MMAAANVVVVGATATYASICPLVKMKAAWHNCSPFESWYTRHPRARLAHQAS
jgi:hypothetical protein